MLNDNFRTSDRPLNKTLVINKSTGTQPDMELFLILKV